MRGWEQLRADECGVLWEHLVLEHLQAFYPRMAARYWRDKSGRDVGSVLA